MRDETYGISIVGLAAGIYGIVACLALASGALVLPEVEENVSIVARR